MTVVQDQPSGAAELPAAEERGSLVMSDRVVERITTRAVSEVDAVTGSVRQVLGIGLGSITADTPARVSADVDGGVVTVDITMSVRYPSPVRTVTRQVREHVQQRVNALTGLRVAEVDITVDHLVTLTDNRRVG